MKTIMTRSKKSLGSVWTLVPPLVAAMLTAGCGSKDEAVLATNNDPVIAAALASRPADPVDLTQFLKAFEGAESGLKLYADETVAVIRARAFPDAVEQLQKLSRNPKLTAAQRQAIGDVTAKLQAR